jgi:CheY-like chemotaxis protein
VAAPASPLAGHRAPLAAEGVMALDILLAEDNPVNQRVAVGLLTRRGHRVTVSANGVEALAALEQKPFDVVLMDVQMPEMGGFEATQVIRQRERGSQKHQRIVAMTAHAMNGDRERCLSAGMDGYLSKPIDPQMLFAAVEQAVDVQAPEQPPAAGGAIDRAEMLQRLGGDQSLFDDVVALFLEDCPLRLAAIKAAVEARDGDAIRKTAHTLKGAAGNLAAGGLFEAARVLERLGAESRFDAAEGAWRRLSAEASAVLDQLRRFESSGGGVRS